MVNSCLGRITEIGVAGRPIGGLLVTPHDLPSRFVGRGMGSIALDHCCVRGVKILLLIPTFVTVCQVICVGEYWSGLLACLPWN